jgi:hypothetical protein
VKRVLAAALACLWPSAGHACAVCAAATAENNAAFAGSTAVLSLLPLAMIGAGLLWLRHRARRVRRGQEMPAPEAPTA